VPDKRRGHLGQARRLLMAALHPLDGEDVPAHEKVRFWNIFAETYTAEQQGDMPERIVEWLAERGCLDKTRDVLEVGSGPGTYSFPMSRRSRSVSCLDSSAKMLDRLFETAGREGVSNLERIDADWNTFDPDRRWDVIVAALCSGSGTDDSIERMDRLSASCCAMVSWSENGGDRLQSEIWARLGKEYSFASRTTDGIVEKLEASGRRPETREFSATVAIDMPIGEAVRRQTGTFSFFGVEKEAVAAAEDILQERSEDGICRFRSVNRLRATVWEPLK
ncbi:MAG: class I SAM-dependent methyltransferase, partial [Candidatus Methanomethylophilaceae archaeon]|nr:class I SAM-dependent methyltransferase [Candidatus Methanomethylophilaceae archaeon]